MQHATYPSLAGQRVIITGGGTGIGVAIVEAFARQGAHVTFLDIAREASLALQDKLAHLPQPPVFRYCDLTDLAALAATFADIEHSAGATDILINNAANDDRPQRYRAMVNCGKPVKDMLVEIREEDGAILPEKAKKSKFQAAK